MKQSTFTTLASVNAVAFITLVPFGLLAFAPVSLSAKIFVSLFVGVSVFMLLMSEENFRLGYFEGIDESYAEYLSELQHDDEAGPQE